MEPTSFSLFIQQDRFLVNFNFNKSLPNNLIIIAKGVRKKKYIKNITAGETTLPSNSPNFIQRLLKGVNNFEFNKPSIRKITLKKTDGRTTKF